ncbi:structural protein [Pseudomonas sp. A-RE-23]|uniref:structural protein n=1 Tax=Pseudomonas sp. A-RE-23 TaxID=2832376 RepID=UPI001CBFA1BC|nr:structural protein [Pseudomonas sp. A-RE-23]
MTTPRGVRNNNPGNIDYNKANKWQGQLPPIPAIEARFARFDTPENGIRALTRLLLTYQNKHGLKTVKAIISRWAPSVENDTAAYVRAVESNTGTKPGAEINLRDPAVMKGFVRAIIRHENAGYEYPKDIIDEGVRRGLE